MNLRICKLDCMFLKTMVLSSLTSPPPPFVISVIAHTHHNWRICTPADLCLLKDYVPPQAYWLGLLFSAGLTLPWLLIRYYSTWVTSAEFGHCLWNFPKDLLSEYCLFVFSLFNLSTWIITSKSIFFKKWSGVSWSMLSKPTRQNINVYVQVMYYNLVLI